MNFNKRNAFIGFHTFHCCVTEIMEQTKWKRKLSPRRNNAVSSRYGKQFVPIGRLARGHMGFSVQELPQLLGRPVVGQPQVGCPHLRTSSYSFSPSSPPPS